MLKAVWSYLLSFFYNSEQEDMVLTPQKLAKLANFPHLQKSWYFIAAATFSVCNKPQEIPKIYHYALKLTQYQQNNKNIDYTQIASEALQRNQLFLDLHAKGELDDIEFNQIENLTKLDNELNQTNQYEVSLKLREAILKSLALGGIPKAINSLMLLKNVTPLPLRSVETERDFSPQTTEETRERGKNYWNKVYSKVSDRVIRQMNTAYPDLWEFTINHVYGPLLSFSGVLSPQESSLVMVSCLIPQDVNPQLKGHLRGALNNGCTAEEIKSCRELSLLIGEWCGVKWTEPVAKL